MNKKQLEAFARKVAEPIKDEGSLNSYRKMLTKVVVEAALNAELDGLFGYTDPHLTIAS